MGKFPRGRVSRFHEPGGPPHGVNRPAAFLIRRPSRMTRSDATAAKTLCFTPRNMSEFWDRLGTGRFLPSCGRRRERPRRPSHSPITVDARLRSRLLNR